MCYYGMWEVANKGRGITKLLTQSGLHSNNLQEVHVGIHLASAIVFIHCFYFATSAESNIATSTRANLPATFEEAVTAGN